MHTIEMENREDWREWLAANRARVDEVWLIFYKRRTGKTGIEYGEAVEEALCHGWVDSLVKRIDDDRYARKFTPRRPDSQWSQVNKRRAEKMIRSGRMTQAGMALVTAARASGEWRRDRSRPDVDPGDLPDELVKALGEHLEAARHFHDLAPSYRKLYIQWIGAARKPETRRRRVAEAIDKLRRGEKLGLK